MTQKLKVLELFSGIGACSKALEKLGIPFEIVDSVEIDKYAVKSFNAIHGTNFEPQDITKWDKDLDVDLVMHGSPCITGDSLILSNRGYIPLRDVKIGDKVLTKSNTWHKVEKKFDNGINDTLYLQGMGFENIHCTPEHKFYARYSHRVGHFGKRVIDRPEFVQAKDLIPSKHYLGIPIIQEQVEWMTNDLDFWYLVGLYLGDGWLKKGKGYDVIFGLNKEKIQKVKRYVDFEKWGVSVYDEGSMQRVRFANKRFYEFIEQNVGTGCFEKKVPGELLLLPDEQLKAVYQGYLDSDGCVRKDGSTIQFSSVNRNLIYSISLIINKLFKRPTKIYRVQVSPKKIIEGREVNQHDWYQLRFTLEKKSREQAFYENGYIWYQYRGYTKGEREHVYNMQVSTDHSYIVQGCISKNCQDFSIAGKQAGGDKGSNTRSSLLYETVRIVKKLKPKYVIWENVKNVLGKKHKHNFDNYVYELDELGYTSFYKVLNARDFGIPQNRERVFTISILRDEKDPSPSFEFPDPIPLGKRLGDILEPEVDEKYYLSEKQLHGMTITNYNSYKLSTLLKDKGDIASTLKARFEGCPQLVEQPKLEFVGGIGEKDWVGDGKGLSRNYPQGNRVYSADGIAVSQTANGGGLGGKTGLYMVEAQGADIRPKDRNYNKHGTKREEQVEVRKDGVSNTLLAAYQHNLVAEPVVLASRGRYPKDENNTEDEPQALRKVRNEYGKQIRKDYEASKIKVKRSTIQQLEPRTDGVTNTITTVQKDNYIGKTEGKQYKIRRLTEKECLRLMGFDDVDYEQAAKVNSQTQLYKQAGNSIVVNVLEAIFEKLLGGK